MERLLRVEDRDKGLQTMIIYPVLLSIFGLCGHGVTHLRHESAKRAALIGTGLATLAAIARGNVGTDTVSYEGLVGGLLEDLEWGVVEPGFVVFVGVAGLIHPSAIFVVRLVSVLLFVLSALYIRRSSPLELRVFALYLLPSYFLQYSMNGLRIGIATVGLYLAFQSFHTGRVKQATVWCVFAVSFHFSILLAFFLFAVISISPNNRRSVVAATAFFAVAAGVLIASAAYVESKVTLYENYARPGVFSGLAPLLRVAVLLAACSTMGIARQRRRRIAMVALGSIASFAIFGGYGGLRTGEVVAAALPLYLLASVGRTASDGRFTRGLLLLGVLGAFNFLRSIAIEAGTGLSPFVPYVTLDFGVWLR